MPTVDLHYFPGWTRKSITFTIDDGNVALDTKFLNIVKPAGILGTFNLTTPLTQGTPDEYRALYDGYEIANHNRRHANPFRVSEPPQMKDELFDPAAADERYTYRTEEEGVYRTKYHYGWVYVLTDDKYMEYVDSCTRDLEDVFGKGKIRSYVWPNGQHDHPVVTGRITHHGFQSVRKTGCTTDTTGFAMPADRMAWSYNANNTNLTEVAALYEAYPDDGALKFFCFGVHSHDFERAGNWYVLEDFARRYGNRPEDYYYASVGTLMDYEDAVAAVTVTDTAVINPTDVDLYIKVDGERITLRRHSTYTFRA